MPLNTIIEPTFRGSVKKSLNPCSNGMPLNRLLQSGILMPKKSLNPCSNGMPLNKWGRKKNEKGEDGLNPCSNGMPLNCCRGD